MIDDFFSRECDPFRNPWEIWLIRGVAGDRSAVTVKIHHALGDSRAILTALTRLLDPRPGPDTAEPPAARGCAHGAAPGARARGTLRALRGLGHLAAAGSAPDISVCGPFTGADRRYVPTVLSARDVARTARRLDIQITDLLITVIAEALGRLLRSRGEDTAGQVIRIAVPRAAPESGRVRSPEAAPRNRTAAVTLDVPISPVEPAQRLAVVRGQVAAHVRRGDDAAAALVLRAMNVLPPPLQRRAAIQLYRHRWFNMLLSVFPGARHSYRLMGARVEQAHPALALADGVGLAVGAMTWERSLSVGVLADAALVPDADKLAAEIPAAFELFRAAAGTQRDPRDRHHQ